MPLTIDVTRGEMGTYKVKLTGSMDASNYRQFDEAIEPALADPDARALRLEMQDLTYISSLGMGAIAKAKKAMHLKGGVLAMVGAQPQIAKVFEIMRLLPKEVVFSSRQEADEYFDMIQQRVISGETPGGTAHPS